MKPGNGFQAQNLTQICDCIEDNQTGIAMAASDLDEARLIAQAKNDTEGGDPPSDQYLTDNYLNPNLDTSVLLNLCRELESYQQTRGCGGAANQSCTGLKGGGKFLGWGSNSRAVHTLSIRVSGNRTNTPPSSYDFEDIEGDLEVFNYTTRAKVSSFVFSSLTGTTTGATFLTVSATGTARLQTPANPTGTVIPVTFTLTKSGTNITFQLRNATTNALISGGTGEPGRANVGMSTTNP